MIKLLLKIELALRSTLTFIAALVPSVLIVTIGLGAIGVLFLIATALVILMSGFLIAVLFPVMFVFFTIGFACVITAGYTEN